MRDRSNFAPALVGLLFPAALLLVYVAGYFGLSNPGTQTRFAGPPQVARFFQHQVLVEIYRPAAAVESAVRSREVVVARHPY